MTRRHRDAAAMQVRRWSVRATFVLGAAFLAQGAYIPAKAALAQELLARAYHQGQRDGQTHTPWPDADLRVEGQLIFPQRDQRHFVVAGASGRSLAFGPGREMRSAALGTRGTTVIGGHRDTHFSVLFDVAPGEPVVARDAQGRRIHYKVTGRFVVHKSDRRLTQARAGARSRLVLVTCYPRNALVSGGPQRLVVVAEEVPNA